MLRGKNAITFAAGLIGAAVFAGAQSAQAVPIVGLTNTNGLIRFDSATPHDVTAGGQVSGLVAGDDLIGIDFRPANGQLYAVGTGGGAGGSSRIYTINPDTAIATQVATLTAAAGDDNPFTTLSGSRFGFDFNPVPDRLRVVSNADQNLRINVDTGAAITDTNLQYVAGDIGHTAGPTPNVVGSAYTNNDADPATGTSLYGIDSVRNTLVLQTNPNGGTLQTVGLLGVDASQLVGFDIFTDGSGNNIGYAALQNIAEGVSRFYTINLATGQATPVGLEMGDLIDGIAAIPEPASLGLLALGGLGLLARRRRTA